MKGIFAGFILFLSIIIATNAVTYITEENLEKLNSGRCLLQLGTEDCAECVRMHEFLEEFEVEVGVPVCITTDETVVSRFGRRVPLPALYLIDNGKVYRYDDRLDFYSIKNFVLGGYKYIAPYSFIRSPLSFVGHLRVNISKFAEKMVYASKDFQYATGLSAEWSAAVFVVAVVGFLIIFFSCVIWLITGSPPN